mgnify:FL=1
MALRRKVEAQFLAWKANPDRLPLVVNGVRQCGKTHSVLAFARAHYEHVAYVNFVEKPDFARAFEGALNVDRIVMMISALYGRPVRFEPGRTVIILDEIERCPQAGTALKLFKTDGRYDVIDIGSLPGVGGRGGDGTCIPVGCETTLTMRPLDFEEFLWASNVPEAAIGLLGQSLAAETPVPEPLHARMEALLLEYAVVGGMPAVVETFMRTRNISLVLGQLRDLLNAYRADMTQCAAGADKTRIKACFDSIPRQLAKDNKKFQYSLVRRGGRSSQYAGALQWIEDAGLIHRCRNVTITELPLEGFSMDDNFKVYAADAGLFMGMLEDGTAAEVLRGNLNGLNGAILENLAADMLSKTGRQLYFFRRSTGLEAEFLIRYKGRCVPLAVKPCSGNAKRIKTILQDAEKYHVDSAIKAGMCNVGRSGGILTIPFYMLFLLTER